MPLFGLRFNFYLRFENDLDFLAFKLGLVKGLNGSLGAFSGVKFDECVSPILLNLNIAPSELFEKLSDILVSSRRWQIVYEHRGFFFNFRKNGNRLTFSVNLLLIFVVLGSLVSIKVSLG